MHFDPKEYTPRRSHWRAIVIPIMLLFLVVILGFFSLVGYYVWQIKTGKLDTSSQFSKAFTTLDNTSRNISSSLLFPASSLVTSHSPTLGRADAPIQLTMFIDFECPYSQQSYQITKALIERYGEILFVVFKHIPITTIHPLAMPAHLASTCAQEQDKFWEYYDQLSITKSLDEASLMRHAEKIGLNMSTFQNCLANNKYQDNIKRDILDSAKASVQGTPTYFINQDRLEGVLDISIWEKIILGKLKNI